VVQENIEKLKAQEDEIRNKSGMAPGLLGGREVRHMMQHGRRCALREISNAAVLTRDLFTFSVS
jgi:hypothetical protein